MKNARVDITKQNLASVASLLKKQGGYVLQYGPRYDFGDSFGREAELSIFCNPRISTSHGAIISNRETDENYNVCTGKKKGEVNREYLLWERRDTSDNSEWSFAASLFDRFNVGNDLELEISPNHVLSCGIVCPSNYSGALYAPSKDELKKSLRFALAHVANEIEKSARKFKQTHGLHDSEIERMIVYALQDLDTNKAVAHNMQAGIDADVMTGLAPR